MNNLKLFQSPEFGQIRTIELNGDPYFVGNDIAIALGYSKPRNAISQHVDNEDALKQGIPDNQGLIQETTLINESGVYSLVFCSKLPTAKKFKKWATSEVLPSIRKHGAYATSTTIDSIIANPENGIKLLQALQKEREEKLQLEKQNARLQPKANFADAAFEAENSNVDIGMSSKILNLGFGRNILFKKLREAGVFFTIATNPSRNTLTPGISS